MNDFTLSPDNHRRSKNKKRAAFVAAIAIVAGAAGGCARYYRTAGTILPPSVPLTAESSRSITETEMKRDAGYNFTNDYRLKIISDGKTIEFIADGCDPERKLAYEWVTAPDYDSQPDAAKLDPAECGLIVERVLGGWTIFVIDAVYEQALENDLYLFRVYLNER